jgi:hypothetical protein
MPLRKCISFLNIDQYTNKNLSKIQMQILATKLPFQII